MSEAVLSIENVAKRFWIGAQKETGARHVIEKALRNPLAFFAPQKLEEFWALRDVNFKVNAGDVLALLGRNGAGKSTLLKLISRISLPTEGKIRLRGRVGSMLEVGTGFHPELTGAENIFLNGALLGMKRAEIVKNFDAIVDFSEVGQFIDTPVKRYSSGMYVRLAFAIAAHMDTEILIVDEVLAVGDQKFQKRCVEKLSEVGRSGRTVLFVSHNPALVQSFCTRGVCLDDGRVAVDGSVQQAIEYYQKSTSPQRVSDSHGIILSDIKRSGRFQSIFQSLRVGRSEGGQTNVFSPGEVVVLQMDCKRGEANPYYCFTIKLSAVGAGPLFAVFSRNNIDHVKPTKDDFVLRCQFELPALAPGAYSLALEATNDNGMVDEIPVATQIEVAPSDYYGNARTPPVAGGPLMVRSHWEVS